MKFCVVVFAADLYRSFVPIFLWSLFKSYPDYDCVVFLRKPLGHVERPGMKLIRGMGNFKLVHDKGLAKFPKLKNRQERVWLFQAVRFLAMTGERVSKHLSGYDYVYTTDVDILILPERVPLLEQHLAHCETLGLPYSNFVRDTDPPRLTGLHFVKAKEYFPATTPIVEKYADTVRLRGLSAIEGLGPCPDEALLYKIVEEAGLGLPPKHDKVVYDLWTKVLDPDRFDHVWFGPHHGLHIGIGRTMRRFRDMLKTKHCRRYLAVLERYAREDDRIVELYDGLHPQAKAAFKSIIKETGVRIA